MKQFSSIIRYVGKSLKISISTCKTVSILLVFLSLVRLFCYKGIGAVLPTTT